MEQLKIFIKEQKIFLVAIVISLIFNLSISIEANNAIYGIVFRLGLIILIALIMDIFIGFFMKLMKKNLQ